ncbi:hypothetical protein FB45DRAFT_917476 [Roridomyces roridus]|uniref:DUF6697 domain-containing protein n=1 Tax=Roridomyces roridus TaxID=1738132 RepID=A0AAD7FPL7_9AGAR|nr:hypothetical protein FB45DRAFT_917476 [Roridomyces roridus]
MSHYTAQLIRQTLADTERLAQLEVTNLARQEASRRSDILRYHLQDREALEALRNEYGALQNRTDAEMQIAQEKILALELKNTRSDAEARKTLEAEFNRREETTNSENAVIIRQLQEESTGKETRMSELRTELDSVRDDLAAERRARATLRQANDEQKAQIALLQKDVARLTKPKPKGLAPELAKRPQAGPSSSSTRLIVPSEPVASCSREQGLKRENSEIDHSQAQSKSFLCDIPESRRDGLKTSPELIPEIEDCAVFTKGLLKTSLGGSIQSLITKIGPSATTLAKECGITRFLCPNVKNNPWSPRAPGQHGFMFVGFTTESEAFDTSETLNLFLGVPSGHRGPLEVIYMGIYEVCRVAPLSVEEWGTLSVTAQTEYAKTTAERVRGIKTPAEFKHEYDTGKRFVPCVQLTAVGFDMKLYKALVANLGAEVRTKDLFASIAGPSPAKRRRIE